AADLRQALLVGLAADALLVLLEGEHVADVLAADDLEDLQLVELAGDQRRGAVGERLVGAARLQVEDGDLDPAVAGGEGGGRNTEERNEELSQHGHPPGFHPRSDAKAGASARAALTYPPGGREAFPRHPL